ncbi:(Fe-S)-cluster assembly protein [Pilimelia anulata]|uniref:(Fe-S)-cluster assembly protein n=1 Tax=Pilimelia anulata TaxID=53371 RepID=A0A8J3AZP8_9ACTN|nr:HhH-GPD-type base excision DNA repair protein [Pilimelia anulata]GGJ77650.1 (Fe-S)-cluster assembly protein [Pilimelia anulata]
MSLALPIGDDASDLLRRSPLALLIGMVLDQQVPMERAFAAPYELVQRLGHEPDAAELAGFDTDALIAVFSARPALHRFPRAMAVRVQEVCRALVDGYGGDPTALYAAAADGPDLLRRLLALPGFGKAKAQIFLALLGKRYGVQPDGWREAAGDYGAAGAYRSVADIVDDDSLSRVRAYKQETKAAARAARAS